MHTLRAWAATTLALMLVKPGGPARPARPVKVGKFWLYRRVKQVASWQRAQKWLVKGNPAEQLLYMMLLAQLWEAQARGEITLVYADEAHFRQDLDRGCGWHIIGKRYEVPSNSPGPGQKVNWYGAYNARKGEALILEMPTFNGENTTTFLRHIAGWTKGQPPVVLIWDNGPAHTSAAVQQQALELGIVIYWLPPYSPQWNPIEGLWKWLREEVTYCHCYTDLDELWDACISFVERINRDPAAVRKRLAPRTSLDPDDYIAAQIRGVPEMSLRELILYFRTRSRQRRLPTCTPSEP